ncbi:beta-Ala-His dipeptidase [Deferribacteraceae bacterium V6Fe1]|nr:beta-Ala-His dipeptidase [Deferribacteraceae bacterium V6Fe1]
MIENIINYFEEISKIPRCSKNEGKIIQYLKGWAEKNNFPFTQDRGDNLFVYVGDKSEKVALQSHVDMVCEKSPEINHDFATDPIRLIIDGDIIKADGTTLGADNGIGVAMMMSLAEDKDILKTKGLGLLFTVDEETGLNGANNLESGLLSSKYMINLDSEDDDEIIIGCAGGRDLYGEKEYNFLNSQTANSYQVEITGLFGGHSGVDIDKNRLNAIKLMGELLDIIEDAEISLINGGTRHNVIPTGAISIFNSNLSFDKVKKICGDFEEKYKKIESKVKVTLCKNENSIESLSKSDSKELLTLIRELPYGVMGRQHNHVVLSSNLAKVSLDAHKIRFLLSIRSSDKELKEKLNGEISTIFRKFNYNFFSDNDYPAWQPDFNSKLLDIAKQIYDKKYPDLKVKVIHAGLECGIIKEKYPEIDVISIGPNIKFPHSINENVSISSIDKVYRWCKEIILSLP